MRPSFRRVIVIGLDGLEPGLVEPMLERGALPNLRRLQERGGFARVATTTPAQTPVAWSSFATGTNPGGHGIFDFLRRDPATYMPDLALNRYAQKNAFAAPRAVNLRGGRAVWTRLADAGIASTVIRCPCTYPPDPLQGRLLSGMGVPDLRGGLGTAAFYTTDPTTTPGEAERVVVWERGSDGRFSARLIGPRNPRGGADFSLGLSLAADPGGEGMTLRCESGRPADLPLIEGKWSEWLRVGFRLGALRTMRGMVRFLLVRGGEQPALYASPINFDPDGPPFPISEPADYAGDLAGAIGPFYTAGMVEDHAGLSNGRLDEPSFLDQCDLAWREREAMLRLELDRLDDGLLFCLFDTPDRVQHMFWRYLEPGHPAHHGQPCSTEYAGVIEDQYRRADAAVGLALEAADDQTLTIALSDHGFGSFRRCVDLNAWLHAQGLLTLRDDLRPGPEAGDLLRGVDWSRTRAYAVGLGAVYLNLQGREGQGIVAPDEAAPLAESIARELTALSDPQGGNAPIRRVRSREALYQGPHAADSPDLVVHFERGYRVSWATSMGGVAGSVIEDNTNAWGGDHIVDPELVPGILFLDQPFRRDNPSLLDLAPTILQALGAPLDPTLEGEPLR